MRGQKQGCKWEAEIWAAVGLLPHHAACSRGGAGCETGPQSSCLMPKPSTACQHLVPLRQPLPLLGAAPRAGSGALLAPKGGDFSPAPPHSHLLAAPQLCLWGYREGNRGRSAPRTACFLPPCLTSVIPRGAHEIPPNTPSFSQVPGAMVRSLLCWCLARPTPPAPSSPRVAAAAPIPPVLASVGIWDFGGDWAELLSNSARLCLAEGRAADAVRQRSP